MSIAITVLLANIYLFNTSQKDFALAKNITEATNLATNRIADFRARVINAPLCFEAGTSGSNPKLANYGFAGNGSPCTNAGVTGDINPDYPGLVNEDFCSPPSSRNQNYPLKFADGPSVVPLCTAPGVRNPLFVSSDRVVGVAKTEATVIDGVVFTLTWVVTDPDLDHLNGPDPEMVDAAVKIKVDVAWTSANNGQPHHVTMTTFTAGKPQ
ncbi:MAG: hypothetical protein ACYC9Y_08685 [Candidatus Methylomirabilia bacterium]